MIICFVIYFIVGLFGVLTFDDDTTGDILKNYGALGGGVTTTTQAMFATSVIISMPTVMVPARESMGIMLSKLTCGASGPGRMAGQPKPFTERWRFELLTGSFLLGAYVIAVLAPSIEVVFSINGVLMGLSISFYLPAAMYAKAGARLDFSTP